MTTQTATVLDPSAGYLTLINTFDVDPTRAEALLTALSKATEDTIRHMPGFVSANFHVSRDRRHVANYAQWRSQADLDAMLASPGAQDHLREAAAIALSFTPVMYDLRTAYAAVEAA